MGGRDRDQGGGHDGENHVSQGMTACIYALWRQWRRSHASNGRSSVLVCTPVNRQSPKAPMADPDRDGRESERLRVDAFVATSDAFARDLVESLIVLAASAICLTHSSLRPPPPQPVFNPISGENNSNQLSNATCILIVSSRSSQMAPKVLAALASHPLGVITKTRSLARIFCLQGTCVDGAEGVHRAEGPCEV